ncbi:hypothetical protein [Candidatus Magnetomonas plexicatena]|uniref:hypothetical protein n=1 Tax=Candidatus Magnetomonas plexicatena TaxID=2552947 RepID=UPI00110445B7|nr:hypothetical protein E2O03_005770 [Nitrospirales bacterium LBB_01]
MKKIEILAACVLLLFLASACTPVCVATRVSCFGYQKPFVLKGSVMVPLCENLFMTCQFCYDYTEIANICDKEVRGCSGRCMVYGLWGSCYSKDERISCTPEDPAKNIKPESEKKSEPPAATKPDVAAEKKSEPKKESEPERKPEPPADTKPEPEKKTEPSNDVKPQPESNVKPVPAAETKPDATKDTESEPVKNQE